MGRGCSTQKAASPRPSFTKCTSADLPNNPNSGVAKETRGTYAGVIEKIPYLKESESPRSNCCLYLNSILRIVRPDGQLLGLRADFIFAPHQAYSSRKDLFGPQDEFRDMVKALHRANIEVILDVVYNHTAEGDDTGPTLCFRGIDNPTYYILKDGGSHFANYSGTGNTLNSNHPVVRRMIVDSLATGSRICMWTGSASTWHRSSREMHQGIRCQIRLFCGTSNPTRRSPAQRSLPRPGMLQDCTR